MCTISSGLADWAGISSQYRARCLPTRTPNKVMNTFAKCTSWPEIWQTCKAKFMFPLFFLLGLVTFRLFCRKADTLVTIFFCLLLYSKFSSLYQFSQAEIVTPHFKLFKFPLVVTVIFTHCYHPAVFRLTSVSICASNR